MAFDNKKTAPKKYYTFFSQGTPHQFNIHKRVNYDGKLVSLLDLHVAEVKFRNRPDTFILTDAGNKYRC